MVLWVWSSYSSLGSLGDGSGAITVWFPLPGGHRRFSGEDNDCAVLEGENNGTGRPNRGNRREREWNLETAISSEPDKVELVSERDEAAVIGTVWVTES